MYLRLTIIFIGLFSTLNIVAQESRKTNKDFNTNLKIGLNSGFVLNDENSNLTKNNYLAEIFLVKKLSEEINLILKYSIWESKSSNGILLKSSGGKIGLEFLLIKLGDFNFYCSGGVGIESVNLAVNGVGNLNGGIKIKYTPGRSRFSFASFLNFQAGQELFNYGGSDIIYNFINAGIGIEYIIN